MDIKENTSVLLKCLGNGADVLVESSPFEIGRCRTARLIIPSVNISRNHCQLRIGENEAWIMEDMSSSGTFLNDELVGKGKTVIIKNNDIIRLGPKDCNFVWQFKEHNKICFPLRNKYNNIDSQSQSILEICNKKDSLQRKIIQNREHHLKMKIEKEKLHMECLTQVKALEEKLTTDRKKMKNQSHEIQSVIDKMVEEKKKVQDEMEQKLLKLQEKINENNNTEEELKIEIQKLQEKLGTEQLQWENRFLEEKKMLQEKIKEQNEKLAAEKLKAQELFLLHGQELKDKLKKEEEEKRLLMEKLMEMEKAKELLSQKLKVSDELHLLEKAKLEEEMKQKLINMEENIKAHFQQQIHTLQKNHNECDNHVKVAELEDDHQPNNERLMLELDRVKNTLLETECRQKLLEKELAQAASLQDEASKVKLNILENIADLMETELQCSICSELFVTAITLNCTHTFCKYCIDTWKKKKKNCPICRKKITSENRSIVMDNYIDKMMENFSEEFKNRRMAVIADRNNGIPAKKMKTDQTFLGQSSSIQSPMGVTQRTRARGMNVNQRNGSLITRPSHSSR